jgi:hypothetical protein
MYWKEDLPERNNINNKSLNMNMLDKSEKSSVNSSIKNSSTKNLRNRLMDNSSSSKNDLCLTSFMILNGNKNDTAINECGNATIFKVLEDNSM